MAEEIYSSKGDPNNGKHLVFLIYLKFWVEVLTAVTMKSIAVFWDVTPCSPVGVYQRFRGMCYVQLQGRRVSQTSSDET
jgi:hypothetical protein